MPTALQEIQAGKKVKPPFMARILNDSKVQDHAELRPLAGELVTVHDVVDTKRGPAFKFRTKGGVTKQILASFTEIVPMPATA